MKNKLQKLNRKLMVAGIMLSVLGSGIFAPVANAQYTGMTVVTNNPTSISENSVFLNGYVSGNSVPTAYFEWGTEATNLNLRTQSNAYGSYSTTFTAYVSGLAPNTNYYYRAVAHNSYETVRGAVVSFRSGYTSNTVTTTTSTSTNTGAYTQTTAISATTEQATLVESNKAELNGTIYNPSNKPTTAYFEWGTTVSLGNRTEYISLGSNPNVIHQNTISGLKSGTLYYFRIVAENYSERSVGATNSFMTRGVAQATVRSTTTVVQNTPTYVNTTPTYINNTVTQASNIINTVNTNTYSKTQSNIVLIISGGEEIINSGDLIGYKVFWQNKNTKTLSKATLQIDVPRELTIQNTSNGSFNSLNNSLTVNLGTLGSQEEGEMSFVVGTNSNLRNNEVLELKATLIYTVGNTQEGVMTYTNHKTSVPQVLGASVVSAGFLPSNSFGWLIFFILVMVLIILGRYIYLKMYPRKEVILIDRNH